MIGRILLALGALWSTCIRPTHFCCVDAPEPPVQLLQVEVFGITLEEVLTSAEWQPYRDVQRSASVVEVFSGRSVIFSAALGHNFEAYPFDVKFDGWGMNLCSIRGFINLVRRLLTVHEYGLCWLAPDCSSLVFANTANTHRSWAVPQGDIFYDKVKTGNTLARVAIWCFVFCVVRNIKAFLEQPRRTWFFELPFVKPWVNLLLGYGSSFFNFDMCRLDPRADGERTAKPHKCLANDKSLADEIEGYTCVCTKGHAGQLMYTNERNQILPVNGGKDMKDSGAYHWEFGPVVIRTWQKCVLLQEQVSAKRRKICNVATVQPVQAIDSLSWGVPSDDDE